MRLAGHIERLNKIRNAKLVSVGKTSKKHITCHTYAQTNNNETFEGEGSKRPKRKQFGVSEHKTNIK
jgi:hypothetical protein